MKRPVEYSKLLPMSVGQTIVHNGRYKIIRKIKNDYIETIYAKPTDKGWRRIEHLPLYEELRPLKIGDYSLLLSGGLPNDVIRELLGE